MKTRIQNLSFLFLSILCFNLLVFSASAQQTKKISMQGFLKDGNGKAVADGAQDIIFKLYTVATGGTAAWTESQTINVFGGVYSTHLGSATNPLDNLNWGSATYHVGVTVQGVELTPRTELTFAPYSLGSPKAQEVVCSGAVGDVKYSILDPTQFATVNGSCWVPMDGRTIAGSKLATITGLATVTNAGGLFLRGQEFAGQASDHDPDRTSASTIATMQDQAMQTHQHPFSGSTSTNGEHTHSYYDSFFSFGLSPFRAVSGGGEGNADQYRTTNSAGNHNHTISGTTNNNNGFSAVETRPKNLNLWTYIRIN